VQVHQFHPTVPSGDAIGNHVLGLQRLLRRLGYRSDVFCERLPSRFGGRVRHFVEYERVSSPENVLVLHFSLAYSPAVLGWLERMPDRKVVLYHNITPHTYFVGVNPVYAEAARAGREQLNRLGRLVEAGWGVSRFNCQELAERGWPNLQVLPIPFEPERYAVRPDRRVLKRWRDGLNVLSVGRIAPNKRLEDVILTFYYLKRYVRPEARLLIVGAARGLEPYLHFLQALVRRLGLADVEFTGHVTRAELVAAYRSADVYLSMSEHEGFGVPLLESMYFDVPIIAYGAAAVPETLDGSGLLLTAREHTATAELIGLLAEDHGLRDRIVARQRERLQEFLPAKVEGRLRELLGGLTAETA
jgi:glycosyltransferase involved in cell wall biosynthesis